MFIFKKKSITLNLYFPKIFVKMLDVCVTLYSKQKPSSSSASEGYKERLSGIPGIRCHDTNQTSSWIWFIYFILIHFIPKTGLNKKDTRTLEGKKHSTELTTQSEIIKSERKDGLLINYLHLYRCEHTERLQWYTQYTSHVGSLSE